MSTSTFIILLGLLFILLVSRTHVVHKERAKRISQGEEIKPRKFRGGLLLLWVIVGVVLMGLGGKGFPSTSIWAPPQGLLIGAVMGGGTYLVYYLAW